MLILRNVSKCLKKIPSRSILKLRNLGTRSLSIQCGVLSGKSQTCPFYYMNLMLHHGMNRRINGFRHFKTATCYYSDIKTVTVPAFAESVTEGDLRWVKSVGDHVSEDEIVGEVETDKAAMYFRFLKRIYRKIRKRTTVPINAPFSGVIMEFLVEDGTTVTPGTQIFKIQLGDAASAPEAEKSPEPTPAPSPPSPDIAAAAAAAAATKPDAAPIPTTPPPAAAPIPTTPPPAAAPIPTTPPPAAEPPKAPMQSIPVAAIKHASFIHKAEVKVPPSDYSKEITGTRTEQRVKMSRMRLRIAQRLKDAQNTNAMLTTFNEVDMGNIMELRKTLGDAFVKKFGFKLGFMSAFVNACAYSLKELPVVNAVIENQEIVYRDYVDISVAVATPKGLVVPVIRNVEAMNYADIERAIIKLGEKAKTGTLAVEDMDGGTFTISNGGVFGSMFGTPIINPPQSAILGMHGIFDRPVAVKGQVIIRPMMYVALTYDHRLIDGREAVTFLRKIKMAVEDPRSMLCGI